MQKNKNPPQSPFAKGDAPVLPFCKGELEGISPSLRSQRSLRLYVK